MAKTVSQAATANLAMRMAHTVASGVTRFLTIATNANKIASDVHKLNALSDSELDALGTTRPVEIERIFGIHAYQ